MKILKKPLFAFLILMLHVLLLAVISCFTPFDVVEYIEGVGVMDFVFIIAPSFVFLLCSRASFHETVIFLQLKFTVDALFGNKEVDLLLVLWVLTWLAVLKIIEDVKEAKSAVLNETDGSEKFKNGNQG